MNLTKARGKIINDGGEENKVKKITQISFRAAIKVREVYGGRFNNENHFELEPSNISKFIDDAAQKCCAQKNLIKHLCMQSAEDERKRGKFIDGTIIAPENFFTIIAFR